MGIFSKTIESDINKDIECLKKREEFIKESKILFGEDTFIVWDEPDNPFCFTGVVGFIYSEDLSAFTAATCNSYQLPNGTTYIESYE